MSFTLLQITDCHLLDQKGDCLLGVDTEDTLDKVLEHALSEYQHIDLIVLSGDLSNDPSPRAYQSISAKLPAHINLAWLPGNHDDNAVMQKIVSQQFLPSIHLGQWQVTLLDSSVPGAVYGQVKESELNRLSGVIKQHPDKYHAVFMHHHLMPVGAAWLDNLMVNNAKEVLEFCSRHKNIKVIANGHVHQEYTDTYAHLSLFSTPSTCFQFLPKSDDFALDTAMPGYRSLTLYDDGSFKTQVHRIKQQEILVDQTATGY